MRSIWLIPAAALVVGAAPAPPAPIAHDLKVAPGAPLVLGVETSGREDCTLGRAPQTRIVVPPRHGTATVRQARVRAPGARCPGAPGYVVIYRSDPDFTGVDDLTLQVLREASTDWHAYRITVAGTPPTGRI